MFTILYKENQGNYYISVNCETRRISLIDAMLYEIPYAPRYVPFITYCNSSKYV